MPLPHRVLPALLFWLAVPGSLMGQGSALSGIRGMVTNSSGVPLELVRIEIREDATGRTAIVDTGERGRYIIANLLAGGPYTLSVSAFGYGGRRIEGIHLQAGTIHRFDFQLHVSALILPEVAVGVIADPRFDTRRSGAATVVSSAEMRAHPSIERNVMELAALSPMAVQSAEGTSIAGQNARFTALQIDGARYQDMFGASAHGAPGGLANARPLPLDAVDQFQVLVAPFDVRHSGFTGGLLNVVTRRGTNRWEAEAFGHYRDHHFLGSLDTEAQSSGTRGFRNALVGVTFGGPLIRDRAHVFAAFEIERRTIPSSGYNLGSADPFAARVSPDSAARFAAILRHSYGLDAGSIGRVSLENPRANLFLRADWQVGRHRLMVRNNQSSARREVEPGRAAAGTYDLGSQVFAYRSDAHATTAQLVSVIGRRWSNEFTINVLRIADRSTTPYFDPAIEVDITSQFGTLRTQRTLRAGGRMDAQANRVTQTSLELSNTLTGEIGRHIFTVGGSAEILRVRSLFTPNPHGLYHFDSLAALEANRPSRFERTLTLPGRDATARFDVGHFSAFVQDEWSPAGDRLTLHFGVRMDVPVLRDRPEENAALGDALGVTNASMPRTTPLWSPRIAFNWQSGHEFRTQLRGGVGLFTGRPAYAWLAEAYARTGLNTAVLSCDLAATPALDPRNAPAACAIVVPRSDGSVPAGMSELRTTVTLLGRDFQYPQDLRIAVGLDQVLPRGFVASADAVLGIARRQMSVRDINLGDAIGITLHEDGYTDSFGFDRRSSFGTPTPAGFATTRRSDAFHQVFQLGDTAANRALSVSLELAGAIRETHVRGAYTFTRSIDVQSLTHRDAAANFGSTATAGDPNRPLRAYSDFDRPHRMMLFLSRRFPSLRGVALSMLYTGESGAPYSYVYGFDINGDGAPGLGMSESYNDGIYVPWHVAEFPGNPGSALAFEQLLAAEPCLARWRGQIAPRNSCRGPRTHRLDLRAIHTLSVRGRDVQLVGDLLNALHLLGFASGEYRTVPSLVPILNVGSPRATTGGVSPENLAREPLNAWYAGPAIRLPDGSVRFVEPSTLDAVASRWQAQIGVVVRM